jgi:hypothetical protein
MIRLATALALVCLFALLDIEAGGADARAASGTSAEAPGCAGFNWAMDAALAQQARLAAPPEAERLRAHREACAARDNG